MALIAAWNLFTGQSEIVGRKSDQLNASALQNDMPVKIKDILGYAMIGRL